MDNRPTIAEVQEWVLNHHKRRAQRTAQVCRHGATPAGQEVPGENAG